MPKTKKELTTELLKKEFNKKKKEFLEEKEFNKKKKEFLEEYEAIAIPLFKKYGLCLVPIIRYTDYGVQPVFAVDNYKTNENVESQPKADGQTDSDNQASQE